MAGDPIPFTPGDEWPLACGCALCRSIPPGIYDRVNETPNSFILKSRIHVDDIRMRSERAFWDRMLAVPNRLYGVTINDEGEAI